ncbi:uncharacterized protein LOC117305879 [Asterias rubens]|uniref:uncharacterized protein LOC117305879 n=1 Tax=Asterias rubens TaxID=7604 RepID=UPI001455B783|nr:uncharacterized protein LOC117305879 [Asterias rubens]
MDDDMKTDLVENAVGVNIDEPPPPPYNFASPPAGEHGQQLPPAFTEQPNVGGMYPDQSPSILQNPTLQAQPTTAAVFAHEECFAECVRFCWCRPLGWLAKEELTRARSLYMAGDYDGAQAAARCANAWSVAGLISGIILCAGIGVGTYFLVTNLY